MNNFSKRPSGEPLLNLLNLMLSSFFAFVFKFEQMAYFIYDRRRMTFSRHWMIGLDEQEENMQIQNVVGTGVQMNERLLWGHYTVQLFNDKLLF